MILSDAVTQAAKQIFGEVLVTAAYCERVDAPQLENESTGSAIEYDGMTFHIHFSSGTVVEFTNSECAMISKIQ